MKFNIRPKTSAKTKEFVNIFFIIVFGRLDEFKYYKNLLLRGLKR